MASEVGQEVATTLHGIVDVIACHTTCRARGQIAAAGEYHRRTIVKFCHTGSNDTHNTFLPVLIVEHDAGVVLLALEFLDNLVGFLGHLLVYILALFVIDIDTVGFCQGFLKVALHEQVHGLRTVLHTS